MVIARSTAQAEAAALEQGVRGFASLRDIEVLRALVVARKMTAAATQLGISQPAVSRTIAMLEKRSGRSLFRREGGRMMPTADALALFAETTPIFDALARLDRFSWIAQSHEPLRVVAPATLAHHFLQKVIADYLAAHDEDTVSLEITTSPDVFAAVADRKADIGISDSYISHPALVREPFRRSFAVCALPVGHPLAARERIAASDLDGENFVSFARRLTIRTTLDRIFLEAGAKPNVRCETATVVSAVELVRAGVGLSVFNPFPVAQRAQTGVVFRPFEPVVSYETAFIFASEGPSNPAARRLADFARAQPIEDDYSIAIL
jgi:DNA-binding transcriptional LysR family regulator